LLVVHLAPRYLLAVMEQNDSDTIAAISTASGEAGIAIVRVSGPDSLRIADSVFRGAGPPPAERPARTFMHGYVRPPGGSPEAADADEVILLIYRAPHSYTREDVVEIQGHGGRRCGGRILRCVLEAGARPAEPGEFTRRAFLNGRIDLLQAEAVLDLIRARSDRAAAAAIEQLSGHLSNAFASIYDSVLESASDLETLLDFADEEQPEGVTDAAALRVSEAAARLRRLLETWEEGHVLRDGALVVIAGRPNVGKSTLLNRLLGKERAIVADTPGTTRDTIEEQLILRGIPLRLVDTAGMRESECGVERQGVERARASVKTADLVLYVLDASQPLDLKVREEVQRLDPGRALLVLNKIDLGQRTAQSDLRPYRCCACSLLRAPASEELCSDIVAAVGMSFEAPPHPVISERHRTIVQSALQELQRCLTHLFEGDEAIVLAAGALRMALNMLGAVTGRVYDEELLDSIFSRFCVGK